MMDVLELGECFLDSPPYRARLQRCDTHLVEIEQCLRTVLKTARGVISATHELSEQYGAFADSLAELGRLEANRPTREDYMQFFGANDLESWTAGQHIMFLAEEMKRVEMARKSFALQLETVFVDPLDSLARTDLPATREHRKRWEKAGSEYLHENSKFMARKPKDAALADGAAEVAILRKEYHEVSLEYVSRLVEVLGKEQVRINEAVLALCQSRIALCEKEQAVFEDVGPNLHLLERAAAVDRTRMNSSLTERALQRAQILERSAPLYNPLRTPKDSTMGPTTIMAEGNDAGDSLIPAAANFEGREEPPQKSGYLYKRSSHTVRPVWSRRFFSLHDNCLEYYTLEGKNNSSTVAIDLRLCTVKRLDLPERRHCFEIVSPVKTYTLQAENEKEMDEWMGIIQTSVKEAIQSNASGRMPSAEAIPDRIESPCQELLSSYLPGTAIEAALDDKLRQELRLVPGNSQCADCGTPDPDWASLSLGVLMCIECSGIHRSLGVHKSKVRSLRLDYWEPEHVQIIKDLGNQEANNIFQANYNPKEVSFYKKPLPESSHSDKEHWILAKYDLCKFVAPWLEEEVSILEVIKSGDIGMCLHWLASNHQVDMIIDEKSKMTPLLVAVAAGKWKVAALFILWSADLKARDSQGATVLHHLARIETFSLSLLISILRRNLDLNLRDYNGVDAMQVAIEAGHGDFVTVLRMFQHDQQRRRPICTSLTGDPINVVMVPMVERDFGGEEQVVVEGGRNNSTKSDLTNESSSPSLHKRQTFRRLLRHYPKFYKRLTHQQRWHRSSSSGGRADDDHVDIQTASLSTFLGEAKGPLDLHREHRRSLSHTSGVATTALLDVDGEEEGEPIHSE